jgi:hypothetical protein
LPLALESTRKAIVFTFHRGGLLAGREFEAVVESVTALHNWVRVGEARRLARAAFDLATDEALHSPAARWLRAIVADMQIMSGELNEGLQALTQVRSSLTDVYRLRADGMLAQALLYSDAIDVQAAIALGEDYSEKSERILGFACALESERDIARALAYADRMAPTAEPSFWRAPARLLLRALSKEGRNLAEDIARLLQEEPPEISHLQPFSPFPIVGAQLYRLAGHGARARKLLDESTRMLQALPPWFYMTVMWHARHMRNALELGTQTQQAGAREFFRKQVGLGYACFARFSD